MELLSAEETPIWSCRNSATRGYRNESRFLGPFGPGINPTHNIFCRLDRIVGGRLRHCSAIGHTEKLVFALNTCTPSVVRRKPRSVFSANNCLPLSSRNRELVQ